VTAVKAVPADNDEMLQTALNNALTTTLGKSLLDAVKATPAGNEKALQTALSDILATDASPVTTIRRNPKRDLVQGAYFKLTDSSFLGLNNEGLSVNMLNSLKSFQDKEFMKDELLAAIEQSIGKELTPQEEEIVLKHALHPSGERATDEEIEAGEFCVAAQLDGEDWWVVLEVEPADIVLKEQEG
jgi:hypothetical protein